MKRNTTNNIFSIVILSIIIITSFLVIMTGINGLFDNSFSVRLDAWLINEQAEVETPDNSIIMDGEERNLVKVALDFSDMFTSLQEKLTEKFMDRMPTTIFYNTISKGLNYLMGENATTALCGTYSSQKRADYLVLELSDGFFSNIMENTNIDRNIDKMLSFTDNMRKSSRNVVYLEFPTKVDTNDSNYKKVASIYTDYSKECEQTIHKSFEDSGIIISSVAEQYPEINNKREYYFKTDHHWKPEAGLLACKALANTLNYKCGYDIDSSLFDIHNYNTTQKILFMGSLGRKVSGVYADKEEITVLKPLFDSNVTIEIPYSNYNSTGRIEDVLYNYSVFDQSSININGYGIYMGGYCPLAAIHNNNVENGKKLLILRESMANVMIPFLAAEIEDIVTVDIRTYKDDIYSYIDSFDPDTIAIIYGTGAFTSPLGFNFN